MQTVAVTLDLKGAYKGAGYSAVIADLEESRVNPWLVDWIGVALIEKKN